MQRLDRWLVERGYYPSREKARRAIMAGEVRLEGREGVLKPGTLVRPGEKVHLIEKPRFVSRGGEKLDGVLSKWSLDVAGKDALDVGASTGGFTQCLLERGTARVIALDVGRGQLHWDLRRDPRVTVLEGINARRLSPGDLPFRPQVVTVDVSFISLRLLLPALSSVMEEEGDLVLLIKPQFEAGRGRVGKGGVVRDRRVQEEAVRRVLKKALEEGFSLQAVAPSPLKGAEGNQEYFAWLKKGGKGRGGIPEEMAEKAVEEACPER